MPNSDSERFDDFLTVSQAADYLGVSPSTLRNWDRKGQVRATRHPVNGYRLYRRTDLAELLRKLVREQRERGVGE